MSVAAQRCGTPGCRSARGHGITRAFCRPCAAVLARIREAFEIETGARCVSFNNGLKVKQEGPKCCTVGCGEPRRPPAAFCDVCVAMGAMEEEAA